MVEDNKIIPFSTTHKKSETMNKKVISVSTTYKNNISTGKKNILFNPNHKKRNKAQFYLKCELSVYLSKKNKHYVANLSASDKMSDYEKYLILKAIFSKIENRLPTTMPKRNEYSEIVFSLLYYENEKDENDFRYICTTQNITKEQLAEYLLFVITMYEMRNPVS